MVGSSNGMLETVPRMLSTPDMPTKLVRFDNPFNWACDDNGKVIAKLRKITFKKRILITSIFSVATFNYVQTIFLSN